MSVVGCGDRGTPDGARRDDPPPTNLILISLDTLRADRLSCYGYERATSPNIDAFAEGGTLFEFAIAESSWTLPSHATLFTGRPPRSHGATLPSRRLAAGAVTLASELARNGYETIALTEGGYVGRSYGLDTGFAVFSENRPDLGTTLNDARGMLAELRAADGGPPFFLFLHTYATHCPYEPPEEHAREFRTDTEADVETAGRCGTGANGYNSAELTPAQAETVSNRYDAGVHAADAVLGPFLSELESDALLGNTIVVIVSDHGEELHEHGRIGHERTLHRQVLHVPLIVRGARVPSQRLAGSIGLADVAPTLLELMGMQVPLAMEGRSAADRVLGRTGPVAQQPRVSELEWKRRLYSVSTPELQLILDADAGVEQLIGFERESGELDLSGRLGEQQATELRRVLAAYRQTGAAATPAAAGALDRAARERLEALGYGGD